MQEEIKILRSILKRVESSMSWWARLDCNTREAPKYWNEDEIKVLLDAGVLKKVRRGR